MVSILRFVSRSRFTKSYSFNSLIKNINVNHQQSRCISEQMVEHLNDLIAKREAFHKDQAKIDKFERLKTNVSSIRLNNRLLPNKELNQRASDSSSNNLEYMDLIYAARTEEDLEVIVEFLRLNKKYILQTHYYSQYLMNLLYILKKPEKAVSLFNDQEIGSLFLNRISVTMLLQNLDAHRMHADIGPVFDKYFSYVVDLTKMGLAKADFIFTEHVVLCTKALYHLNSQESMKQFRHLFQRLLENGYYFSAVSLMHLTLLGIEQNEAPFVLEGIEKNEKAKFQSNPKYKTNVTVIGNLKAILLANTKQIEAALSQLQEVLQRESTKTNLYCIWPTTMDHLSRNCVGVEQLQVRTFTEDIKNRLFNADWDLLPFMEHLTKIAIERKTNVKNNEKRQPIQFYNKSNSDFSANEDYAKQLENINSNRVSLRNNNQVEDQIQRLQFLLVKLDEKLELLESKYPGMGLDFKQEAATNRALPQLSSGVTEPSELVKELKKSYKRKNYSMVIKVFHKLLDGHDGHALGDQMSRNELVNIFSDSVSNEKFVNCDQIKFLIDLIRSKWNFKLPVNCQFLIALRLMQLDSYYLLEFLVDCDELRASQTSLYRNIMTIGLALNGKIDIALDQVDTILATSVSTEQNSFDGKIFIETMKVLNDAISRTADSVQTNRLENISLILGSNKRRFVEEEFHSIYPNTFQSKVKQLKNKSRNSGNESLEVVGKQISRTKESTAKSKVTQNKLAELTSLNDRVSNLFDRADYSAVIELCEKAFAEKNHELKLTDSLINAYSLAILRHPATRLDKIKELIDFIKNKLNTNFPVHTENKIYHKLVELEPVFAVGFLSNGSMAHTFPNLYKNLLSVGLCLTERFDEAWDIVESLLEDKVLYDSVEFQKNLSTRTNIRVANDNIYQGKLFKKTIDSLNLAASNSKVSSTLKDRLERIQKVLVEQPIRMISRDPVDIKHRFKKSDQSDAQ